MQVARLGYLGIATNRLDAWRTLATDILGAEIEERTERGARTLALRLDTHPYRYLLIESDDETPPFAGWEVDDAASFDALAERLHAAGAEPEAAGPAECAARGVAGLLRFRDPDGYPNELYHGAIPGAEPALPHGGFVTGDLGIGHVMRHCAHYPEAVAFYRDVMGLRTSDKIVWDGADATFMRCNPRHHSLALINECLGMASGDTNHIMFEMRALEDVVTAYDRVLARGDPLIMTLGRHSNCRTISFYFVGPSGFGIEIGHGSALVEDEAAWAVREYDTTKIWGHLLPHERLKELI